MAAKRPPKTFYVPELANPEVGGAAVIGRGQAADVELAVELRRHAGALTLEELADLILDEAGGTISTSSLERWSRGQGGAEHKLKLYAGLVAAGWLVDASELVPIRDASTMLDVLERCSSNASQQPHERAVVRALWSRTLKEARRRGATHWGEARWRMLAESQLKLAEQTLSVPSEGDRYSAERALGMVLQLRHFGTNSPSLLARGGDLLGRVHHNLATRPGTTDRRRRAHAKQASVAFARAAQLHKEADELPKVSGVSANHARLLSMLLPGQNERARRLAEQSITLAADTPDRVFVAGLAQTLSLLVAGQRSRQKPVDKAAATLDAGLVGYGGRPDGLPALWRHFHHMHAALVHVHADDPVAATAALHQARSIGEQSGVSAWARSAERLVDAVDRPSVMLRRFRLDRADRDASRN